MASSDGVSRDRIDVPARRDLWQRRGAAAGRDRHALRHRQRALRKWAGRQSCPHRLVSFGLQHSARLRGVLVRRRACSRRPAPIRSTICGGSLAIRASSISRRSMWTIRIMARRSTTIPSTPAACAACSTSPRNSEWGQQAAGAARARRRRSPQFPDLCRRSSSMSLSTIRADHDPSGRCGRGLRPRRQSRPGARADGRRRDHGYQQRALQQHQHQTGARSSRAILPTIWSRAPTSRLRRTSTSSTATRRRAAWASRAFRLSRRRSATPFSQPQASEFALCLSTPR